MLEKILNILLYANVGKENYEKVKPRLTEANRHSLILFSMISAILSGILYGVSYANAVLESSRICYQIIIIGALFCIILANTLAKRIHAFTYIGIWTFATLILSVCTLYGTYIEPDRESLNFTVMIFVMPLLFIDISLRNILGALFNIIIYIIVASHTQKPELLTLNLTNIIAYELIGIPLACFLVNKKIQSFVLQDKSDMMDEIVKLNSELVTARKQAEASNAAKTSFLFNMSHDIRTPMNAISGFTKLLRKHQEEEDKRNDYLTKIETSSNILLSIINNILDLARIEKGTVVIENTVVDSKQLSDNLYTIFQEMMNEKNINFSMQMDVQHNLVECDPTRLREVLMNVISNAFKYTNAGGSISMKLTELPSTQEGYALYRTIVADTGIGMSSEFLPHIFEEFSRENNTTGNKIEGTGLGLPIVKRFVELMNGTIEVESKQGVGTTVTITIPHKIASNAPVTITEHEEIECNPDSFQNKRILLAEDNDLNAEIAKEILCDAGFTIDRAEDGLQCLEMLQQAPANYYNVILMDIQMPRMNGHEATQAIRNLSDSAKSQIPIIAMTANAFEEDKRLALKMGMNDHVAKPINLPELMKALTSVLS